MTNDDQSGVSKARRVGRVIGEVAGTAVLICAAVFYLLLTIGLIHLYLKIW